MEERFPTQNVCYFGLAHQGEALLDSLIRWHLHFELVNLAHIGIEGEHVRGNWLHGPQYDHVVVQHLPEIIGQLEVELVSHGSQGVADDLHVHQDRFAHHHEHVPIIESEFEVGVLDLGGVGQNLLLDQGHDCVGVHHLHTDCLISFFMVAADLAAEHLYFLLLCLVPGVLDWPVGEPYFGLLVPVGVVAVDKVHVLALPDFDGLGVVLLDGFPEHLLHVLPLGHLLVLLDLLKLLPLLVHEDVLVGALGAGARDDVRVQVLVLVYPLDQPTLLVVVHPQLLPAQRNRL